MNRYSKESEYKGTISEVFGVKINSRYDRAHELFEILNFLIRCRQENVEHYISEVFYDSGSDLCHIEFHDIVKDRDPAWSCIFNIAHQTISQFEFPYWAGICHSDEVYVRDFINEKLFAE